MVFVTTRCRGHKRALELAEWVCDASALRHRDAHPSTVQRRRCRRVEYAPQHERSHGRGKQLRNHRAQIESNANRERRGSFEVEVFWRQETQGVPCNPRLRLGDVVLLGEAVLPCTTVMSVSLSPKT